MSNTNIPPLPTQNISIIMINSLVWRFLLPQFRVADLPREDDGASSPGDITSELGCRHRPTILEGELFRDRRDLEVHGMSSSRIEGTSGVTGGTTAETADKASRADMGTTSTNTLTTSPPVAPFTKRGF